MDKELLKELLLIIEKTKEGILKGVEIAQEQMPNLIQQVYSWEFSISVIGICVGVAMFIPLRWYHKLNKSSDENEMPLFLGYAIPTLTGIVMIVVNVMKCVKIVVAIYFLNIASPHSLVRWSSIMLEGISFNRSIAFSLSFVLYQHLRTSWNTLPKVRLGFSSLLTSSLIQLK